MPMSQVLNSATSSASDHGVLIVSTPSKCTSPPAPLILRTNGRSALTRRSTSATTLRYGAVVGLPIQPTTGGLPSGDVRSARGTNLFVSTQVGIVSTDELWRRANSAR